MEREFSRRTAIAALAASAAVTSVTMAAPSALAQEKVPVVDGLSEPPNGIVVRIVQPAADDPIFAAISRSRAAEMECDAATAEFEATEGPDAFVYTEDGDWRSPRMAAAIEEAIASREDLAMVVPTTLAGFVALLGYVAEKSDYYGDLFFEGLEEKRAFIRSLWTFAADNIPGARS